LASDPEFARFVLEQLRELGDGSHRRMFGEYAIYVRGKVVALICDNELYLKPTAAGRALLGTPVEAPPFPGAKQYFVVGEYLDDPAFLAELFRATEAEVEPPKRKGRRRKE